MKCMLKIVTNKAKKQRKILKLPIKKPQEILNLKIPVFIFRKIKNFNHLILSTPEINVRTSKFDSSNPYTYWLLKLFGKNG